MAVLALFRRLASHQYGFGMLMLVSAVLPASSVSALDITPLAGIRDGGRVVNEQTLTSREVDSSSIYGVILAGELYDDGQTYELYYSRQSSEIRSVTLPGGTTGTVLPLSVEYLHLGGTAPIRADAPVSSFVSGGLGFTYMDPDVGGLSSEWRPSFSVGIGLGYPFDEHVSLRLEARFHATFFNTDATIFCSGGCAVSIDGNLITQFDMLAGVGISF